MALEFVDEIENWDGKPKELVLCLVMQILSDSTSFPKIMELLKTGSKVERGTCADILKHVSKLKPEIVAPYINTLVENVNDELPRVKWGTQEAIGNLAQKYPEETSIAIPRLLVNTKDESTVIRWCAAYAISEIAKSNTATRTDLMPKMQELAEAEANNGVRNVYLKALKKIGK